MKNVKLKDLKGKDIVSTRLYNCLSRRLDDWLKENCKGFYDICWSVRVRTPFNNKYRDFCDEFLLNDLVELMGMGYIKLGCNLGEKSISLLNSLLDTNTFLEERKKNGLSNLG